MSSYTEFLASKSRAVQQRGFELETHYDFLWDWQHELVEWACRMGTAALFEDCGLGKTRQQLAWAHAIYERTGRSVLIVAPLAVAEQTRREGYMSVKLGRKFVGFELKPSYFDVAARNLADAVRARDCEDAPLLGLMA